MEQEKYISEIIITEITPEETIEAAKLCAAAFLNTPYTKKTMGGNGKKQQKFLEKGMKMLMKAPGRVFAARDDTKIVGVMRIVEWPDCQKSAPRGPAKLSGLLFGGNAYRNLVHFRNIWKKHDPKEPHWHLDPLCVLPQKQGQGIGSKLLTYYTSLVDKAEMMAYHETEQKQNERLYNKFGFVTKETEMIFGMKNYFMWRERKQ